MRGGFGTGESFWSKYGARTITYVVGVGLFVVLALLGAFTSATTAKNTEVAIIVNNITGSASLLQNGGMVLHLPFGLSSVYKVDKSTRVLKLTQAERAKEHPAGDQVNIKTNDGSNVEMDVEVVYQLMSSRAEEAYRELGGDLSIQDILRALTRSQIRSEMGELSTLEISESHSRTAKLNLTEQKLKALLEPMGIEVVSVNAKNFDFADEYEQIIRERKQADQTLINQKDYQEQAVEEGKRMVAEATRDRQTALAQLKGELDKKILVAEGEAKRIKTKAEQQAYQSEREGEIALKTAEQDAAAVRAEGQRKAEGMEKLFEAYEKGGEGLVREALAKLYNGVTIKARPYAVSETVEQFRVAPAVAPAGQPAPPRK